MDGQNGGYRPRTAGDRTGAPGSDGGVRDWQKHTWFGPAPLNSNPFDEPEDAPELRESRSENVTEHVGEFWRSPERGYSPQQQPRRYPDGKSRTTTEKKNTHSRMIRAAAIALVVITAVALVLRFAVFSVKEIRVSGNNLISAEEIIRISGIRRGDSILTLNEDRVKERIQSDYRLQFRYVAREMPGVMDKNRMVLYESENPAEKPADLVEVKGLEVRSNTLAGQYINLGNETQQSIFTEMFLEMKVLGCTDKIAEADISNTNSILLLTRDGYTASLGDRQNIHAKLRSLLLVQEQLKQTQNYGGTINVSNPESPIYTP